MTPLTAESIQAARQYFADNELACIKEVCSGKVRVNDIDDYFTWCLQRRADYLAGRNDHTFTLLQYAHYIQTGEMRALLP